MANYEIVKFIALMQRLIDTFTIFFWKQSVQTLLANEKSPKKEITKTTLLTFLLFYF